MRRTEVSGVLSVAAPPGALGAADLLTGRTATTLATLDREFASRRAGLLLERRARREGMLAGLDPVPDPATESRRADPAWRVPGPARPAPARTVDLDTALVPTWANVVDAHRRAHRLSGPPQPRPVPPGPAPRPVALRPRDLRATERHVYVEATPVSATVFDVAVFLGAAASTAGSRGPCLQLPRVDSVAEATWWADLLDRAEHLLGLVPGSVGALVSVDSVAGALALEDVVDRLGRRCAGLQVGGSAYTTDLLRGGRLRPQLLLPGRLGPDQPFQRALLGHVLDVADRRGSRVLGAEGPATGRLTDPAMLLAVRPGPVGPDDLAGAVGTALAGVEAWVAGRPTGSSPVDTPAAEVVRGQVWQWVHHGVRLTDGTRVTRPLVRRLLDERAAALRAAAGRTGPRRVGEAADLLGRLLLGDGYPSTFTEAAYERFLAPRRPCRAAPTGIH